ncbi:iron ABC transporter permease [Endozoicomonas sp. SM1973]|uniref:Iron ABC transporter permease n=1 Tax=Spartinivicinus marinus TaxID=2994442 RepID=A0A853I558_9GAMM|nr:iron ABC transporter permease [Spartinivicinus marinus]MCX4029497.1 iron ABC transporter permease [Spartinivicinus marinus]NYZ65071.1 iron ABC transporter permease [Spartinivicinus marinus]
MIKLVSIKYNTDHALVVRLNNGNYSLLFDQKIVLLSVVLTVLLALTVLGALALGATILSIETVIDVLLGQASQSQQLLVNEFRLPRIIAGIVAGFALAIAGSLIQHVVRNRLATPDVLGINEGAALLMLIVLISSNVGLMGPWWVAPVGALVSGILLLFIAKRLGTHGYRVILVGLALTYLVRSLSELMLAHINSLHASATYSWSVGNLNGRGYEVAEPVVLILAILMPFVLLISRQLRVFQLGEDIACTLGTHIRRVQFMAICLAIILAGLAVGIGGPIGFVAIAAPVVINKIIGGTQLAIINTGLLGGILVVVADTLGRLLVAPLEIPVGVLTSILGGPFLLWVLLSEKNT